MAVFDRETRGATSTSNGMTDLRDARRIMSKLSDAELVAVGTRRIVGLGSSIHLECVRSAYRTAEHGLCGDRR